MGPFCRLPSLSVDRVGDGQHGCYTVHTQKVLSEAACKGRLWLFPASCERIGKDRAPMSAFTHQEEDLLLPVNMNQRRHGQVYDLLLWFKQRKERKFSVPTETKTYMRESTFAVYNTEIGYPTQSPPAHPWRISYTTHTQKKQTKTQS